MSKEVMVQYEKKGVSWRFLTGKQKQRFVSFAGQHPTSGPQKQGDRVQKRYLVGGEREAGAALDTLEAELVVGVTFDGDRLGRVGYLPATLERSKSRHRQSIHAERYENLAVGALVGHGTVASMHQNKSWVLLSEPFGRWDTWRPTLRRMLKEDHRGT
jgi:hypothetical protein